jgi:hypothetical protein
MPKVGSKTANEDRLRKALRDLLEKLGVVGVRSTLASDERLVWMAERVEPAKEYFVADRPDLDESLPF